MIAELFSAIRSVFGSSPSERTDEIERFRARNRMRSRQQRVGGIWRKPQDPASDREEEQDDDDAHRRRKVTRSKGKLRPSAVDKRALTSAQKYTASTYQSYLAPPSVYGDELYPDSPVVHEHQVLMMNAFDFSASPEAFLYDNDDDAALYADGGASSSHQENQSLWRRRFSSGASDSSARAPRLSPKLGADALWESHYSADTAADKLRAESDAHFHACYCPAETRGLYYD